MTLEGPKSLVVIVIIRVVETAGDSRRSCNDESALTEGVVWLQHAVDGVGAVDSEHQRPTAGDSVGRAIGSARLVRVRELVWPRAVVLGLDLARLRIWLLGLARLGLARLDLARLDLARLGLARLRDWRLDLARLRDWRLGLARLRDWRLDLARL